VIRLLLNLCWWLHTYFLEKFVPVNPIRIMQRWCNSKGYLESEFSLITCNFMTLKEQIFFIGCDMTIVHIGPEMRPDSICWVRCSLMFLCGYRCVFPWFPCAWPLTVLRCSFYVGLRPIYAHSLYRFWSQIWKIPNREIGWVFQHFTYKMYSELSFISQFRRRLMTSL